MRKLLKYFKNYYFQALLGPIFKLIEAIMDLFLPFIMATMINNSIGEESFIIGTKITLTNNECIYLMIGIITIGYVNALLCQYFAATSSIGFGANLRNALFKHFNQLSYSEYDKIGTVTVTTRITNDVNQLQQAVATFIRLVFRAPVLALGALIMAFMINFDMALIFSCCIPLVIIVLWIIMKNTSPMYKKVQEGLDKISNLTRENIEGVRVVRAFAKEKYELEKAENISNDYKKNSIRVTNISSLLNPLSSLIMNFGIIAIIWLGARLVYKGDLAVGEISAFITYILWILLALTIIANMVVLFTKASASARRINEILDMKCLMTDGEISVSNKNSDKVIEFKNVSFAYDKGKKILNNINLCILRGENIGVIGSTASGKSTLINLIPRFYDVTEGEILVDGVNIRDYHIATLRKKIAIVPQKAIIFSGTIKDNIIFGMDNVSEEDIINAAKAAQAYDFIMNLKDGFNSKVLEEGRNFSGGQIQRLSIARAIIRKPEILILDDCSSALDYTTEAALKKALKLYLPNMTLINISERVNPLLSSDKIIVLANNTIAANGKHSELIDSSPIYQDIYRSQNE